jgi:phage/plasmid-like protein (TIGR03299 family)
MTGPIMGGIAGDPYESNQDLNELNQFTLIGCTDVRGDAWHRRDDLQGSEDNHYPGHIPTADVLRKLFNWEPQRAEVAYLVPFTGQPVPDEPIVTLDGETFRLARTKQGRIGVLRGDTHYDLGVFRSGATHPPYQITLLREAERLTGSILGISTAGLLQEGARAWIEYSMPQTQHDSKSGLDYRPNLVRADSMDGSIALTTALTIEATVCMNTLTRNLLEASNAGRIVRRKHTRGIVAGNLDDERAALGILEQVDAEFLADLHRLIDTPVTEPQVIEVLDVIRPLPEDEGRAMTMTQDWRDEWMTVYREDPMAAQWKGTAFGVVQADNTFRHHYDPRRGGGRWETNTWRALTGKTAAADRRIVRALESVLA